MAEAPADKGWPPAQANLGVMYSEGLGVTPRRGQALK